MAITQIEIGNNCLMCDDPLPKGKIFVCGGGRCEDVSGINDMSYPDHIPISQQHQVIAKRIVARREYLKSWKNHVMMDTREFIKGLNEI